MFTECQKWFKGDFFSFNTFFQSILILCILDNYLQTKVKCMWLQDQTTKSQFTPLASMWHRRLDKLQIPHHKPSHLTMQCGPQYYFHKLFTAYFHVTKHRKQCINNYLLFCLNDVSTFWFIKPALNCIKMHTAGS